MSATLKKGGVPDYHFCIFQKKAALTYLT